MSDDEELEEMEAEPVAKTLVRLDPAATRVVQPTFDVDAIGTIAPLRGFPAPSRSVVR